MKEKEHNIKNAKESLLPGVFLVLVIIIAIAFIFPGCASSNDSEEEVVMKAAREFLDAEVRRDYPVVYASFASSSEYVRSHSYEEYLAEAQSSPDRIVEYRIVKVTYIQDNEDRKKYPAVEKFAQVEVEVTFMHAKTQHRSEINIGFIFLKERGRWYKS